MTELRKLAQIKHWFITFDIQVFFYFKNLLVYISRILKSSQATWWSQISIWSLIKCPKTSLYRFSCPWWCFIFYMSLCFANVKSCTASIQKFTDAFRMIQVLGLCNQNSSKVFLFFWKGLWAYKIIHFCL